MKLLRATESDLEPIVDLMNRAYRGEQGWAREEGYLVGERIRLQDLRADIAAKPDMQLLVWCDDDGALLGCVSLEPEAGDAWFLGMLTVEPRIQERRLGRNLLAEAERVAAAAGARRIRMTVIWVRTTLIAWYQRRGYLPTGEMRPFPYGDDRWGVPQRDDLYFVVLEKPFPA